MKLVRKEGWEDGKAEGIKDGARGKLKELTEKKIRKEKSMDYFGGNVMLQENEYGTRKIQMEILDIMRYLDSFCRENDIRYSLSGGTLLGAVRHHGFIPWDDDIDVMFDRPNYEKLKKALETNLDPNFVVIQPLWVKRLSKVTNERLKEEENCVDFFVFDNVPNSALRARLKIFLLRVLRGMLYKEIDYSRLSIKNKIFLFVTGLMGRPFSQSFKQKLHENVSQWGNHSKTEKITIYNTFLKQMSRIKYEADIVDEYMELDFEGEKFMAFAKYDSFLTELYGNYMELPPVEERVPAHIKF